MKKKIVLILPRGESIKNFVYSGVSDALRLDFEVVFFSVVPNNEIKNFLITKCDAFYELKEDESVHRYLSEVKTILQIAHTKKLNSVTGNLKMIKDDFNSKRSLKSQIIRSLRKAIAMFFKSQKSLEKLTNYFVRINFNKPNVIVYEEQLKKILPDIVFNTSHIHNLVSLDLMYAVKKLKIKSTTFLFSWDNLTSQGRIIPNYDYYFTWNEKIKNDLLKFYPAVQENHVFITGTTQFDFHFDKEMIYSKESLYEILGVPTSKKIILYSTGMSYYCPKEDVLVKEISKVLKQLDEDLQLVVRIYAKDDNTAYYKLREEDPSICIPDHFWEMNHLTPTLKDMRLYHSLVHHCNIGINVASTVSLELAILNKPIINIGFNPPGEDIYPNDYEKIYEFDHYKPIVDSGAVSVVKSTGELKVELIKYLNDSTYKEEERIHLVSSFFGDSLETNKREIFLNAFKKILS